MPKSWCCQVKQAMSLLDQGLFFCTDSTQPADTWKRFSVKSVPGVLVSNIQIDNRTPVAIFCRVEERVKHIWTFLMTWRILAAQK